MASFVQATFQIISFNAENPFRHAKVLNLSDQAKVNKPPQEIGRLKKLLGKPISSIADKREILELSGSLKELDLLEETSRRAFDHGRVDATICPEAPQRLLFDTES